MKIPYRLLPSKIVTDLTIEECLTPSDQPYMSKEYKIDLELSEAGRVWIKIPEIGRYGGRDIQIGPIYDKSEVFKETFIHNAVSQLVEERQHSLILNFLRLAPYWISDMAKRADLLEREKGSFGNLLILYRLTEICLGAIEQLNHLVPAPGARLETASVLLHRQRYLYLAQLPALAVESDQSKDDYIQGYSSRIRYCRQTYARLLTEQEELAVLAFGELNNGDQLWNLDGEAHLLINLFARIPRTTLLKMTPQAWSFTGEKLVDTSLTDILLRKWFLAHDNLAGAVSSVFSLLLESRWFIKLGAWGLANTYLLNFFGLILFFGGCLISIIWDPSKGTALNSIQNFLLTLSFIVGLFIPIAALISIYRVKRQLISRQSLYPIVLRVPAMGLVGVLAIEGLMDSFVRYTLNGFTFFWPAFFIIVGSLGAAFAYILFEVQIRSQSQGLIRKRAWALWWRGFISTLWLAIIFGWLVDPIGLTACTPDDIAAHANCTNIDPYGCVLILQRSVRILGGRISLDYVFLVGAIALLVGVFTQIFWEDKAIAEPL